MIVRGHLYRILRNSLGIKGSYIAKFLISSNFTVKSSSAIYHLERVDSIIPPYLLDCLSNISNISKEELYKRIEQLAPQVDILYNPIIKPNYNRNVNRKRKQVPIRLDR